ncbi:uncharacterized protein UTRI_01052_B [Ustilago trichophora]|uniref:F-box domain-containing protein n=1 Tax=Ustilago trichophora TaxID=86804 RepID=A0A5C3DWJ9_9BASI|nr:uncharacterized protein UTRI_01052_B [Ustilago trichophora]
MSIVLPDEVVYQIFSYLDAQSLGNALQASTTFYRIATAPALWELPYLLRWSTGDAQREAARGTHDWRRNQKLKRLQEHARRSAIEKGMPSSASSESPFRFLQLVPPPNPTEAHPELDFYRLFLERIHIDQQVIDTLYQQVEATHDRIPTMTSLALRLGNDAKDVLTAVVEAQSTCPSSGSDGRPFTKTAATASQRTGNRCTRTDSLAYDSGHYRLKAYQAHLPTTLRSETHHLTETAVSLLTMFRGGEATYVESQLDVLAAACDLYLQQRFSTAGQSAQVELTTLEKAKEMATSICDFLADHGFRGARDDLFSDLDNHFLHHCFTTNRETLPLSLTLIFCGIANRLGLRASLCNFPMRILAFVMADAEAPLPGPDDTLSSAPQNLFWLDVCEYTTVAYDAHEPTATDAFARRASWLQQRPPILDRADLTEWTSRMGVPPSDDFWRPAQPDTMVQRAARSILTSVQRAQITPRNTHPVGQARSAIRNMEIGRRSARLELQWSQLVRMDHAFLSSFHGRTDPVEHEAITAHVAAALESGETLAEDETTWRIVRTWRAESMRTLNMAPETWVEPALLPAARFRQWMHHRALDNDWTRTRDNLYRRADSWSEHEQQAAKYAAVNAFLRLSAHVNAREVDWIAGFLQSYFMLDVEVIERDFLGVVRREDEDGGSESSGDEEGAGFTIHAARTGKSATTGIVTNPSVRIILARMLQAVRAKDAEVPRVNRRAGLRARRKRRQPANVDPDAIDGHDLDGEADQVGYRVGTIFRHRTYRYVGSILGWDPYCAAPEDWIVNMGVDRLPAPQPSSQPSTSTSTFPTPSTPHQPRRGGRHQPFYHSQVADGTRRYVAEVNVEPIPGPIWIYGTPQNHQPREDEGAVVEEGRVLGTSLHKMLQLRGLGEYFRCFDQVRGRLRRNLDARTMFPDDWSDDDDDEDEEEVEQEVADAFAEEGVERLSEDGSW